MPSRSAKIAVILAPCALAACGAPDTHDGNSATAIATPSSVTTPLAPIPAEVAVASDNGARGAMAAIDARRHGPQIVAFAGVQPGDVVIDLIPGSGYWTKLFAGLVGAKGHVYGIWPAPYAAESATDVAKYGALAGSAAYPNVSAATEPATEITAPQKADIVFTSQNYHDYPDKFMGKIDPAVVTKAVFDALKPGGTYLIVDHSAAAGSGMRDTDTLHRIDPAIVFKVSQTRLIRVSNR